MRFVAVILSCGLAACAGPRVSTTLDLSLTHAEPLARDGANLSFAVPPQSLARCVAAARHTDDQSDPLPVLTTVDTHDLWDGCASAKARAADRAHVVDSATLLVSIDAEGHALETRVLELAGEPSAESIACVSANARRKVWSANANGRPYEQRVTAVTYASAAGATSWRMADAVRRLSEPRRAVCNCMRDYPLDRALEMSASLTLAGDAWPHDVTMSHDGPLASCVAEAIRNEAFATVGDGARVTYAYHFDPTDPDLSSAIARGEKPLPTDNDDPHVAVRWESNVN